MAHYSPLDGVNNNRFDHLNRLRRSSFTPSFNTQEGFKIVVEESGNCEDEDVAAASMKSTPRESLDIDSPSNPYLLSPWRDPRETRKHSLPSQQVTEGITASQVRRLSERGGEGSGPSPKEAEFLATLSQAPQPSGRRHSVVTISKVPFSGFGRGRRESVAAYPCVGNRLFGSRRESQTSTGPPATEPLGSIHNLQLDIMDDIVDSRKARIKVFNTSSERICEVQTVDEAGNSTTPMRYTNRRYSDFTCSTLTPIPAGNRRASENPVIASTSTVPSPAATSGARGAFFKKTGIVVTNTDLMSIISSLASSATEINKCDDTPVKSKASTSSANTLAPDSASGGISRSNRSNSFDVSILQNAKQMMSGGSSACDKNAAALSGWFEKRHQPALARKKSIKNTANATVSFSRDVLDRFKDKEDSRHTRKSKSKLRWDNRGFVDANAIGSAIEGFLRKGTSKKSAAKESKDSRRKSTASTSSSSKSSGFWFGKTEEDDSKDTCDASLCTTIKDLFVK